MNLLKLLGFGKKPQPNSPYPYKDILHLWEDDYLMLELLPTENLEFIKSETKRINDFAEEHFDGTGFTEITPVSEKPLKTIERLIDIAEVEAIIAKAGLEKISQLHIQGVGLLQGDKVPLGFGTNRYAIMCDRQDRLLKHIWVTGHADTDNDRQKLGGALLLLGQSFNLVAVNWFQGEYYNLIEESSVADFIKNSC